MMPNRYGRQVLRVGNPLFHRRLRDLQELRREPRGRRPEPGEDRADALEFSGDILVPRIDVALQLRIAENLVLQDSDLVVRLVRLQHRGRAARERSFHRAERVHLRFHLLHSGFPGFPVRIDRREVPAVLRRDFLANARVGLGEQGVVGKAQRDGAEHAAEEHGLVHRVAWKRVESGKAAQYRQRRSVGSSAAAGGPRR
jgi:hypothetical protein